MLNKARENKFFLEACEKAGLKVQLNPGNKAAKGLVIIDARGNKYEVNEDAKIKKVAPVDKTELQPGYVRVDYMGRTLVHRRAANGCISTKRMPCRKKTID